jgi:cytochrome c
MRVIVALVIAVSVAPATLAADAEHGKELYQACAACHTEKPEAMGPSLKGVFGRKTAALDDFHYSNPMKRANFVWDEANLRAYLVDPQARVKGNRMPFSGLREAKDVDDVIAYLKTLK